MLDKLVVILVVLYYASSASGSHLQGYCERGLYIPSHVIKCVNFCVDHDKVLKILSSWHPADILKCECVDGSIQYILPDSQSLQCQKVTIGESWSEAEINAG